MNMASDSEYEPGFEEDIQDPPVPQKKEIIPIGNKVVSIVTLHFIEREESCIMHKEL